MLFELFNSMVYDLSGPGTIILHKTDNWLGSTWWETQDKFVLWYQLQFYIRKNSPFPYFKTAHVSKFRLYELAHKNTPINSTESPNWNSCRLGHLDDHCALSLSQTVDKRACPRRFVSDIYQASVLAVYWCRCHVTIAPIADWPCHARALLIAAAII